MVYKITQSKERPAASLLTMLRLESDFLDSEAHKLLNYCLSLQNWERESLSIFGKNIQLPRLVVAYSDCHQNYAYSRITHKNNPLTQTFNNLLERVSSHLNIEFNHLLLNHYRDGTNGIGWHSDNEKQLGNEICTRRGGEIGRGGTRFIQVFEFFEIFEKNQKFKILFL